MVGKEIPTVRQRVMERVVDQLEPALAANAFDAFDRLGFVAQGADLEPQGFDHADQVVILQHRFKRLQRHPQGRLPFAVAHALIVIARDQADRFGPGGAGDLHQGQRLSGLGVGPVVEALDLSYCQQPQAFGFGHGTCRRRVDAVKKGLGQVIAHLDPDAAKVGRKVQKGCKAYPGDRHVV